MIAVSMLEFLRTGRFGPVALGATTEDLRRHFGEPDAVGGTSRRQRTPLIWKYGDVEFHFGREAGPLWMIFMDDFALPGGGARLAVDPWIVSRDLPLGELQRQLQRLDLPYRLEGDEAAGDRVLVTAGDVHLAYRRPDGAPDRPAQDLELRVIHKRDKAVG